MDFILNERSLHGQFQSTEHFLESLQEDLRCFELVRKQKDGLIRKVTDLYKRPITKELTLGDLKYHIRSERLLRLKIALDKEMRTEPYWDLEPAHNIGRSYWLDDEDVTATAVAEAAHRQEALLSFDSERYRDRQLQVRQAETLYPVISAHRSSYLVKCLGEKMGLDRDICLKARYVGTRLDLSLLEPGYGADILEKDEYHQLLGTLDKFAAHDSWETIALDDGLEYKKYSPSSSDDDWFHHATYRHLSIMKFRFSDKMRCFGYRKGDRFRLLRIERDHKRSDKG